MWNVLQELNDELTKTKICIAKLRSLTGEMSWDELEAEMTSFDLGNPRVAGDIQLIKSFKRGLDGQIESQRRCQQLLNQIMGFIEGDLDKIFKAPLIDESQDTGDKFKATFEELDRTRDVLLKLKSEDTLFSADNPRILLLGFLDIIIESSKSNQKSIERLIEIVSFDPGVYD